MGLDLVSCGRTAVTEVEERGGALFKDWICGRDGRRGEESPRTYGEDQAQFQIFGSPFQKLQLNNTENCPLRCRLKGLKISAFLHEVWCEEL